MKNLPHRLFKLPGRIGNVLRIVKSSSSQIGYVGWVGGRNLGDETLFQIISTMLSPTSLFSYSPTPFQMRLLTFLKQSRPFCRAICLGGGTLIGKPYYLQAIQHSLSHRVPVFSFGTGVLDPTLWKDIHGFHLCLQQWKEALLQFEQIAVRGKRSAAILKELGIKKTIVVGDPVLALADDTLCDIGDDLVLGVNVGKVLNFEGHTKGVFWGSNEGDTIGVVAKALISLATKGWSFRLFGVVPEDEQLHSQLVELVGSKHFDCSKLYENPRDFITDAAKCCVFLGLKLHSTILAYSAFTPVIMLEYEPKCSDFMSTVGRMDYNVRTDRITSNMLVDLVEQARHCRNDLRKEQLILCQTYKQRLLSFAEKIINSLGLADSE